MNLFLQAQLALQSDMREDRSWNLTSSSKVEMNVPHTHS